MVMAQLPSDRTVTAVTNPIIIPSLPNPNEIGEAQGKWMVTTTPADRRIFFSSAVISDPADFTHMPVAKVFRAFTRQHGIQVKDLEMLLLGEFRSTGRELLISFQEGDNVAEFEKQFQALLGQAFRAQRIEYQFSQQRGVRSENSIVLPPPPAKILN